MKVEYAGQVSTARALAAKLSERPKCRVCGMDIKRGPDLCTSCEQGYEAARNDFVAWLRTVYPGAVARECAGAIARGDADGFAAKERERT
jgi:hypothetical protein